MVADNADMIIHNSEAMCNSWEERYGTRIKHKLVCLPMPFSIENVPAESVKKDKLIISHIGNLYAMRNVHSVLSALGLLLSEDANFLDRLELRLVGKVTPEDVQDIQRFGLQDVVKLVGRISEEECVRYYNESDVFLVVEGVDQGRLFFPSKLIRYYSYKKPVLGITLSGSVLSSELKKNGHHFFEPDDIAGIKDYMRLAMEDYSSLCDFNKDAWAPFEKSNVAKIYAAKLRKMLNLSFSSDSGGRG